MGLTVIKKRIIDDEAFKAAMDIGRDGMLSSVDELKRFALVNPEIEPRVVIVKHNNEYVGMSLCYVNKDRVNGVYLTTYRILGYTFFDYNGIFFKKGFIQPLLNAIKQDGKESGCDVIIFDNLISKIDENRSFHFSECQKLRVFNAKNSQNEFDFILNKKSWRRDYEKLKKNTQYKCVHKKDNFNESEIEALARLHIERWSFAGVESAFKNHQNRIQEYCAYKDNKLLTFIYDANEIIACHYGMIHDDVLIFHTPVINVKYLKFSPLKALILETVQYCQLNGINVFDLGLGDESYKDGITNSDRKIYNSYLFISKKGLFVNLLKRYVNSIKIKNHFKRSKELVRKIISIKRKLFRDIMYFEFNDSKLPKLNNVNRLTVIDKFDQFVDLMRMSNCEIKKYQFDRFKQGHKFLCLLDKENKILSYGWMTNDSEFYVGEIDKTIDNSNKTMLYDFETPEVNRRKGHYKNLLAQIIELYNQKRLVIFALKNNAASIKAIKKVGFRISTFHTLGS